MKISKRRFGWLAVLAALVVLAIGWLVVYLRSGLSEAISLESFELRGLQNAWVRDGSPQVPQIGKYKDNAKSTYQTYVWTNTYEIGEKTFRSLFATDDSRFWGRGILVISKDGMLIWVDKKKGPQIVETKL